ncbi:WD40 repeat domain-containing protein, partial [Candidatus Frankia alpina]|uniref:WD40 repeat domain-containing protein n=1 Tax=Candidatus Frankia alpina TaxID=2699483 RepID=UPI003AF86B59
MLSPDATIAVTTSDDATLHLWNTTDRAAPTAISTQTLRDAGNPIAAMFNPAGTLLAVTTSTGVLFVLDATDPVHLSILATVHAHDDATGTALFTPDGTVLATNSVDGTVRLWDLTTPRNPQPLARITPSGLPLNIALSADGHTLATADLDGTATLWDITAPRAPRPLSTIHPVDGASRETTGTVTALDITRLATTGAVTAVAFSPDVTRLATADAAGTARLWNITDPHDPRPLATLTRNTATISAADFTPDGSRLITAGDDSTARLWDLDPASVSRRACANPSGQLTPAEGTRRYPEFTISRRVHRCRHLPPRRQPHRHRHGEAPGPREDRSRLRSATRSIGPVVPS